MKVEHSWGFIPNLRSFIILCFHANEQKNAKDAKAMLSKASSAFAYYAARLPHLPSSSSIFGAWKKKSA